MNLLHLDQLTSFDIALKEIKLDEFLSVDTYNESEIKNKIDKLPKETITLLVKLAIHIAVIGVGNKNYGKIMHNNKEMDVIELLRKCDVKLVNVNAKLNDTDLTPNRLTRFFRYQIKKFIKTSNRNSYLFKFSTLDEKYKDICFRGGEYLVENEDEANFLLVTAKNISIKRNFDLVDKFIRIFNAKNISFNKNILV